MRILTCFTLLVLIAGCSSRSADRFVETETGPDAELADGPVVSYATFDPEGTPNAVGVSFSSEAMESLPTTMSDEHHCFDRNGNGTIESDAECIPTHERVLFLPGSVVAREDIPFKWVLLNWNPMGHVPPGIYDKPHFDVHFMIEPVENIFAIEPGPCGPEFVRCDQFERGRLPVPAEYVPEDFQNFDAVVPGMGNHLIDATSPELHGEPFTRSWIYGAYDGRITFYEEMVTTDYLLSRPDTCFSIKQPSAVEVAGYYPTESCLRYDEAADAYTVALESFVHRDATPRNQLASAAQSASANH